LLRFSRTVPFPSHLCPKLPESAVTAQRWFVTN